MLFKGTFKNIEYSKTCLIWDPLGETYCVGIDRVSDYNIKHIENENTMSDNTGKQITYVWLDSFTVFIHIAFQTSILFVKSVQT